MSQESRKLGFCLLLAVWCFALPPAGELLDHPGQDDLLEQGIRVETPLVCIPLWYRGSHWRVG